jgi:uncharacterized membrane protein
MERPSRTLVKSVVWSLLGLLVMTLVGFAATGSWSIGVAMAVVNTVIGFVTYLIYERLWARIPWGRDA